MVYARSPSCTGYLNWTLRGVKSSMKGENATFIICLQGAQIKVLSAFYEGLRTGYWSSLCMVVTIFGGHIDLLMSLQSL